MREADARKLAGRRGVQRAMREPTAGLSVKPTEPSVPFDDQQSDGLCHLLGAAREGGAGPVRGDPLPLTIRGLCIANDRRNAMAYETKKQQRERFIAEFVRRLREAPPGTRVYMRVGDVFKDADVVSIDELRAAREVAGGDSGEDTSR